MSEGQPPILRVLAGDVARSLVAVFLLGAVLFAATGVWPPMVAVESGSMEPHLERGDLVLVTGEHRFSGPAADEHGIVTNAASRGYGRLGGHGDVLVFSPPRRHGSPIIHRAVFHVAAGENWYDRANTSYVDSADSCAELANCPAPHAGYITRGDANGYYDQARGIASPVRPAWVEAKGQVAIPFLGEVRLALDRAV